MTHFNTNFWMNRIYAGKYPYFEQYRTQNQPWPWEVNEKEYNALYTKLAIITAVGNGVLLPSIFYTILHFNLIEYDASLETFPTSLEFFKTHIFLMLCLDFGFYWIHRIFHTPWLYKTFHKQHHRHSVAVAIITIDNDHFDYIISVVAPFIIGPLLLGKMHVFTALIWHVFATQHGILGHCGYNMPWYPFGVYPFGVNLDFHDYHHSNNVGNYAFFFAFWDYMCSTNKHYNKTVAEKDRIERAKMIEKSKNS